MFIKKIIVDGIKLLVNKKFYHIYLTDIFDDILYIGTCNFTLIGDEYYITIYNNNYKNYIIHNDVYPFIFKKISYNLYDVSYFYIYTEDVTISKRKALISNFI